MALSEIQTNGKRKRTALKLSDRVKVIQRSDNGESAEAIALTLGVGKTQIQNIVKEKAEISKLWESGGDARAKFVKLKKCLYEAINEKLHDFVSGELLKEQEFLFQWSVV